MTCGHQLIAEIRKLNVPSPAAPKTVAVAGPGGVDLAVDVTALDSMSCSCRELRMRVPSLTGAGAAALKKWADALCARITYLLEHLGPLEVDTQGKQVLVRSTTPDKRGNTTSFYEVLLQSQGAGLFTLRRYRREPNGAPREHVDLQTTHELLEKLADDLMATIPA
jgi:hypothetical protein